MQRVQLMALDLAGMLWWKAWFRGGIVKLLAESCSMILLCPRNSACQKFFGKKMYSWENLVKYLVMVIL